MAYPAYPPPMQTMQTVQTQASPGADYYNANKDKFQQVQWTPQAQLDQQDAAAARARQNAQTPPPGMLPGQVLMNPVDAANIERQAEGSGQARWNNPNALGGNGSDGTLGGAVNSLLGGDASTEKPIAYVDKRNMSPDYGIDIAKANGQADLYGQRSAPSVDFGNANSALAGFNAQQAQSQQARMGQNQLVSQLQAASMGQGPSQAQMQLSAGRDANIAQSMAMANSARGGAQNFAAAHRQAADQGMMATQASAQQAALLRQQEMVQARGELGQALTGQRGQDQAAQNLYNQQYGQGVQQGLGVSQQALTQGQYNDIAQNNAMQRAFAMRQAQSEGNQQYEKLLSNNFNASQGYKTQADIANANNDSSMGEAIVGAAGTALGYMVSDRNLKTEVADVGTEEVGEFLDKISPYRYHYTNPTHGHGLHYGVMAQDVEQSTMGRTMVVNTDEGKMLDMVKTMGAILASLADINRRLKDLETR